MKKPELSCGSHLVPTPATLYLRRREHPKGARGKMEEKRPIKRRKDREQRERNVTQAKRREKKIREEAICRVAAYELL